MAEHSILVRYFAAAAEHVGSETDTVVFDRVPTLGAIQSALIERHGRKIEMVLSVSAYLVSKELTRDRECVVEDAVDVLPPFAGG
ncbi:MoaD/ThiS family protein [Rhodococcus sp. IEGM 1307]|uniref:MoaD/ThiS family protein n=1 Tax=Rhodococcus sp. IEGM 1307 TaxID=3047091 RepID=UPI0024B66E5C|nr:MoaD/ThiS family protein [Rhodococcus sp. IEGM 1307]MDI9978859.1 MoaD/ThiS family protein [Rhodococcus sp. IEGM 1307]